MDKFAAYNIEVDEKYKILINNYLQNIKNHVEENSLDFECYEDIEEMFFEKLSSLKQINELNIKKIIKEVWEPEIIFWETKQTSTKNDDDLNLYQKLKNASWEYENDGAIVLWISGLLAKKLWLSVWIVRIILLIMILFWWLSIWLYFGFWIVFPVKTLDYNSKNIGILIKNQLIYVIQKSIKNIIKSFFLFFPFVIKKSFEWIKSLFWNIFPIIRFFGFWFAGIMFLGFVLVAITLLAFYYSDFSIWNVVFLQEFPIFWIYGTIFWLISVLILWIWSLFYAFWNKIFHKNLYILAIISIFASVFFFIVTWLDLAKKYIWETQTTQKIEYEIQNSQNNFVINIKNLRNKYVSWFWSIRNIEIIKSENQNISFELETQIFAWEKIANTILQNLNAVEALSSQNIISLQYKENKIFKNEVPFAVFENTLKIFVPENITFSLDWYWYYGVFSQWEYLWNCYENKFSYDAVQEKFICK